MKLLALSIACLSGLSTAGAATLPEPLAAPAWSPPAPTVTTLSNGIPVWILPRKATSTFEIALVLSVGEQHDPPGLEGLIASTFDLADEGAGSLDASAFDAAMRALGAEIIASTSGDTSTIRVRGLARNLEPSLDLWAMPILQPSLRAQDLAIVTRRRIDRVALQLRQPAGAADRLVAAAEYGTGYLGRSPTEASLRALTADAAATAWAAHVTPSAAAIIAGGDITAQTLLPLLEARLGAWKGPSTEAPAPVVLPEAGRETLRVANVEGAPQSAIRALLPLPSPTADPAQRAALDVAFEVLGASFTSRVNRNLREDKGWTYGARCRPVYSQDHGYLECATLVRANVTADAVKELRRELIDIVGDRPITGAEIASARGNLLRSWPTDHETQASLVSEATVAWRRGLPTDAAARWLTAISKVDQAAADKALRAHLSLDKVDWVVVGDLATTREGLTALGLPLEEVTP